MATTAASPIEEKHWFALTGEAVASELGVDAHAGLAPDEADEASRAVRPERLRRGRDRAGWRAFVRQYADPMQIVLLVAGLGSLYPLNQSAPASSCSS